MTAPVALIRAPGSATPVSVAPVSGLNALLATVTTDTSAPVIVAQRLRKGPTGSPRDAKPNLRSGTKGQGYGPVLSAPPKRVAADPRFESDGRLLSVHGCRIGGMPFVVGKWWSSEPPGVEENRMTKVVAIMSMSLDGYVADLNDGVAEVFDWYLSSGDVEINTGGSDPMTFRVSEPSADHVRGLTSELGAVLTGRRTFEVAQGWGGNHAWGPAFVLTHQIPAGWPRPGSTVHFVTDGLESAVKQAKAAA